MDERGWRRCKGIRLRRALVLAACLALLATFAAPAAANGPIPDPGPGQKRTPAPDPAPQAAPQTVRTITHAVSTSAGRTQYTLPTSTTVPSSTQPAITSSRHHASTPAVATPRRTVRTVTSPLPPSVTANPAAGVLRALGYDRLAGDVRTSASSFHEGLLILGASILLLIVLGEVGFLAASARLVRRAI